MGSVNTFLSESLAMSRGAACVYLLYFVLVSISEMLLTTSSKSAGAIAHIALINAIYTVFLCQVLTIAEFLAGWKSRWLGGEASAVMIVLVMSAVILFYAKKLSLAHAGLEFANVRLICLVPLLILYLPLLAMIALVFAIGSNWKN